MTVEKGFRDLESIMSGSTKDKSASTSMIKMKADLQLEATTCLLTIASRLESAVNVLEECTKLFCNNQTSRQVILKKIIDGEEVHLTIVMARLQLYEGH